MQFTKAFCLLMLVSSWSLQSLSGQQPADSDRQYARVLYEGGKEILQSAVHTYVSENPDQPPIVLLGNFHLGTPEYFQSINQLLDQGDLILFEAPGRPRFLSTLRTSDKQRAARGRSAGKYIRAALDFYASSHDGHYPHELEELFHDQMQLTTRSFLARAIADSGWNEPWQYHATGNGFHLTGLGADGQAGGKKYEKDLLFDQESKVDSGYLQVFRQTRSMTQTEVHRRMQMVDQGSIIDYSQDRFVLSDVDATQVKSYGIANSLRPPNILGDTPAPEPGTAEQEQDRAKHRRTFISMNDPKKVPWMFGKNVSGRNKKMYELMVVSRNELVAADLKWILKQTDQPKNIYVLYGAGHMMDLEHRIVSEMGYSHQSTQWLTVVSALAKPEPPTP